MAENDIRSVSSSRGPVHLEEDKGRVYFPEYISSSRPIKFQEDDSVDNTWVSIEGVLNLRFVCMDLLLSR